MSARKRKPEETFEQYRKNLKKEHFELNHRSHKVWDSKKLGTLKKNK